MPELIQPVPERDAKAEARNALSQIYSYYAFDWQPFAPASKPSVKNRT